MAEDCSTVLQETQAGPAAAAASDLAMELETWRERVPKLARALEHRSAEIKTLQQRLRQRDDGGPGVEARDALIEELRVKLEQTRQQCRALRADRQVRQLEVEDLQLEVQEWEQKWGALTRSLDETSACANSAQLQRERALATVTALESQLVEGQQAQSAGAEREAELRRTIASLENRNAHLFESIDMANSQIDALGEDLTTLQARIDTVARERDEQSAACAGIKERLDASESARATSSKEYDKALQALELARATQLQALELTHVAQLEALAQGHIDQLKLLEHAHVQALHATEQDAQAAAAQQLELLTGQHEEALAAARTAQGAAETEVARLAVALEAAGVDAGALRDRLQAEQAELRTSHRELELARARAAESERVASMEQQNNARMKKMLDELRTERNPAAGEGADRLAVVLTRQLQDAQQKNKQLVARLRNIAARHSTVLPERGDADVEPSA